MLTLDTLNLGFDDFAKASADPTIACALTKALNHLAEQTKQKVDKAAAIIDQVETELEHSSDVQNKLEEWQLHEIEGLLQGAIKVLKEDRTLTIDKEFILKALYGSKYPNHYWDRSNSDFRHKIFSVWDPAKLIHARNQQFGNLAEAEKRELFKQISRFIHYSGNDNTTAKQINFHFHFFREESYEKGEIRHNYNRYDYDAALRNSLRLLAHYYTHKPLEQCLAIIPVIFNSPGPFSSSDIYRWHPSDSPGTTRFRFYKGGRFLLELETSELKDRFLHALATYTAETD